MKTQTVIGLAIAGILLAGCQSHALEEDFGNSVAHMIESQKAHPEVSANPDPNVVDGTDIHRSEAVLDAYRRDVSKPEEVNKDLVLKIGQGR